MPKKTDQDARDKLSASKKKKKKKAKTKKAPDEKSKPGPTAKDDLWYPKEGQEFPAEAVAMVDKDLEDLNLSEAKKKELERKRGIMLRRVRLQDFAGPVEGVLRSAFWILGDATGCKKLELTDKQAAYWADGLTPAVRRWWPSLAVSGVGAGAMAVTSSYRIIRHKVKVFIAWWKGGRKRDDSSGSDPSEDRRPAGGRDGEREDREDDPR